MLNAVLQDSTFRELRALIYDRSGIFIPDAKKYLLESRLMRRLQERNLSSFEDYLYFVKYSNNGDELSRLFDAVTTNETFFFREPSQLDVLTDFVMPEISADKGSKDLRIWSAACSTGEEPYTIAMLLAERCPGWRAEIIASDISDSALKSARRAVYSSYAVRNVPGAYLKRYFKNSGQTYELDSSIRNSVKFLNINLIDRERVRTIRNIDVIFCRNVLIYFDDRSKHKAVSHLYDSLRPGGFLFVGLSESLHNVTRAFRPVIINRVVVYQKV